MPELRLPERLTRLRPAREARSCPPHRAWVRRHRCSVPGCERLPIECAHVRTGTDGGQGLKPSDRYCLSLCRHHHGEQHRIGERAFEARYSLELLQLAELFAVRSPHRHKLLTTTPAKVRGG
jgi:hypothetical protein